jgi:L-amino acid N-acyltransferase YncA
MLKKQNRNETERKEEDKHIMQSEKPFIREMISTDSLRVLEIYRMGIETGNATFETQVPDWKTWDLKHLPHSRFVSENNGYVSGWVALSSFSSREVYCGVAEVSIYVDALFRRKGIGSALMNRLILASEKKNIWTLFSSVFPENEATLNLHLHHGFRITGKRERIAQLHGIWRDTLLLERRSSVAGQ